LPDLALYAVRMTGADAPIAGLFSRGHWAGLRFVQTAHFAIGISCVLSAAAIYTRFVASSFTRNS